jgi:cytidylate kinase
MFRLVTVAREYGSGGAAIARRVADRLGWSLLDKSLIEAVARRAQVDIGTACRYDESVDSWWRRVNLSGCWSAAIYAGMTPAMARLFDAETAAEIEQIVIEEAASKGNCVIVGRGAQCVLRGLRQALHVFVYAPWAERIARIRERLGNGCPAARLLRSVDHTRAAYVRRRFGCDWRDPHLYQMTVNSQLGIEEAASLITAAVRGDDRAAEARELLDSEAPADLEGRLSLQGVHAC